MGTHVSLDSDQAPPKCRLVVVGSTLAVMVRGKEGFGNHAEIVGEHADLRSWTTSEESSVPADLAIVQCPSLFADGIAEIEAKMTESGLGRAIVVYDFAHRDAKARMTDPTSRITTLRAPINAQELRAACEADIALATLRDRWESEPLRDTFAEDEPLPPVDEIPPRRFSDEQLAKINAISSVVDCECPQHLSSLLASLNAFEAYSRDCENRDEADAILHAYLHRSTAKARALMEEALVVLAEAEGFDTGSDSFQKPE